MEGTTEEQDKIRRMTLFISVLLLLSSVGSYLLYQHFYQPELQVTFVSKKILPETKMVKKLPMTASKVQNKDDIREASDVLQRNPLVYKKVDVNESKQKKVIPKYSDPKIFQLTIEK